MPRLRAPLESQEQIALMEWVFLHETREPRLKLLLHIPNGELREKATAAKLKRMGVRPGVFDLFLPIPMRHTHPGEGHPMWEAWHGLWIEMKPAQGGRLSEAQAKWYGLITAWGYAAYVAHGWLDAAKCLCRYLRRDDLLKALEGS